MGTHCSEMSFFPNDEDAKESDDESLQQLYLLDEEYQRQDIDYDVHWQGMPMFEQFNQVPVKQLIVSFACTADIEVFSRAVDQKVTMLTKSIWFPNRDYGEYTSVFVSDETDR